MKLPRLPYWLHVGRSATPVGESVYVMREDGTVVETPGSAVLRPRMRFFAASTAVTNLVRQGLVKRLKHPEADQPKKAPEVAAEPANKSPDDKKDVAEKESHERAETSPATGQDDEVTAPQGDVVASDAGEAGEASDVLSEPEEKESRPRGRRKKSRRE